MQKKAFVVHLEDWIFEMFSPLLHLLVLHHTVWFLTFYNMFEHVEGILSNYQGVVGWVLKKMSCEVMIMQLLFKEGDIPKLYKYADENLV